jgi:hypothetical protein
LVSVGLIEDMSITSVPGFSPSATPARGGGGGIRGDGEGGAVLGGQAGALDHRDVVARGLEMAGHGAAHDAEADEGDLHAFHSVRDGRGGPGIGALLH